MRSGVGDEAKEWWWVVSEGDTADYVEPAGGGFR